MKKWFRDNTLEAQPLSREAAIEIFRAPEDKLEEVFEKEKFIVLKTIQTPTQSIQITFNTLGLPQNNSYHLFGFDLNDELLWRESYPSHTIVPPVWSRLFGGMDYCDWLAIQRFIQYNVPEAKLEINEDTGQNGDFSFYFTQDADAYEKLQRGEQYRCINVFAAADPVLVQRAKDFVKGFKFD